MKKAILLIDLPECCGHCPFSGPNDEYGFKWYCDMLKQSVDFWGKQIGCPLIPLTEYEEAMVNEIISEKKESEVMSGEAFR